MHSTEYELELKSGTGDGKDIYRFRSADGVEPKDSFRDAELLLADEINPEKDEDILVVKPGFGFLGAVMADKIQGEAVLLETSDRARQLCEINLEINGIENASCRTASLLTGVKGSFDRVVYAPKDYSPVDLVKNRIAEAAEQLETGGRLHVAGNKYGGINRYRDYLGELGEVEKTAQRGGEKIYTYTKEGTVEPRKPDVKNSYTSKVNGVELELVTAEGLFSPGSLDNGTRLLLENLELSGGDRVLDVGCGYGAIGIFFASKYGCEVFMSDDSALATSFAEKNIERNSVENCRVETSDCLEAWDQKFDAIVSNPPTHQGKAVTEEIIQESFKNLKPGGELYLVYNQQLGFKNRLEELPGNTETLAEKDNYVVARTRKS